jgi:rhodanese-related sulfurtransferase
VLPWWVPFGSVPEVDAHELARRLEQDAPLLLLDVRSRFEFARGHIAGSVSVPFLAVASRLPELQIDPDATIVAVCLTAHRSIPAVRLLQRRGYSDVVQLAGGMLAWRRAGLPTVV